MDKLLNYNSQKLYMVMFDTIDIQHLNLTFQYSIAICRY